MHYILGVDEVGMGAIAGPLVVGAALVPADFIFEVPMRDPKHMTVAVRRCRFGMLLERKEVAWGTAWALPKEVDQKGIRRTWSELVYKAIKSTVLYSKLVDTEIIVDGNARIDPQEEISLGREISSRLRYKVKADESVLAVQLASLAAKVTRDEHMFLLADSVSPAYGFITNSGYPSEQHRNAVRQLGRTIHHRKTFCVDTLPQSVDTILTTGT